MEWDKLHAGSGVEMPRCSSEAPKGEAEGGGISIACSEETVCRVSGTNFAV